MILGLGMLAVGSSVGGNMVISDQQGDVARKGVVALESRPSAVAHGAGFLSPAVVINWLQAWNERIGICHQQWDLSCGPAVIAALRLLVRAFGGNAALGSGLQQLLHDTHAPTGIETILTRLTNQAERMCAGELVDQRGMLVDMQAFGSWLGGRIEALQGIAASGQASKDVAKLFGVRLRESGQWGGTAASILETGLFVPPGDAGRWLRVLVYHQGKVVKTRAGWEAWSDPAGMLGGQLREALAQPSFSSVVPLRTELRRPLVVEEVTLPIPWAALELPIGNVELEAEVQIVQGQGRVEASVRCAWSAHISESLRRGPSVPAPQVLGVWPRELTTGTAITAVRVEPRLGRGAVQLAVDLLIADHVGEELCLSLRCLSQAGDYVRWVDTKEHRAQFFEQSVFLFPHHERARIMSVLFELRGADLDLLSGASEAKGVTGLSAELTLAASDGRVLCGALAGISLDSLVGESDGEAWVAPQSRTDALLPFNRVHARWLVTDGKPPSIAVALGLVWNWSEPIVVVCRLETVEGAPVRSAPERFDEVSRRTYLPVGSSGVDAELEFRFDGREFGRFFHTLTPGHRELQVRCRAETSRGVPLCVDVVPVRGDDGVWDDSGRAPRPIPEPQIVAVQRRMGVKNWELSVTIEATHQEEMAGPCWVQLGRANAGVWQELQRVQVPMPSRGTLPVGVRFFLSVVVPMAQQGGDGLELVLSTGEGIELDRTPVVATQPRMPLEVARAGSDAEQIVPRRRGWLEGVLGVGRS